MSASIGRYPVWAFLLGCGVRIGELVWLRWPTVELDPRRVRIFGAGPQRQREVHRFEAATGEALFAGQDQLIGKLAIGRPGLTGGRQG